MAIQGPSSHPTPGALAALAAARPQAPARPAREPERASAPEAASLWDLLTPDERTFFTQLASVGQLSYGPTAQSDERNAAAPTGQRLDVRG